MTLWDTPRDASVKILGFSETLPPKFRLRLEDLGFVVGMTVMCLLLFSGPRVFYVGDAVFALEKDVAMHVNVEEVEA